MPVSTRASSPPTSASPSSSQRWCELSRCRPCESRDPYRGIYLRGAVAAPKWITEGCGYGPLLSQGRPRLISPPAVDDILQCAAGLETLDLAGDISGNRVGIGVGRIMRREHDLGMGPERALRRQRLLGEDVERGRTERAVVEAGEDVS